MKWDRELEYFSYRAGARPPTIIAFAVGRLCRSQIEPFKRRSHARDLINPEHTPDFVCKYRIRLADISRWPSGDPRYQCVARFFASGRPKSS